MAAGSEGRLVETPPQIQNEIYRRERNRDSYFRQQVQKVTDQQKRYGGLDEVLAPRRQQFAAQGLDEARAVAQLFSLSDAAAANPAGFIRWFADQKKVDLATLTADQQPTQVDPQLKALQDEIGRLKGGMLALHNTRQVETRAQSEQQIGQTMSVVKQWASETDANGQPKRPYFEALEDDIADLVPRIKARNPGRSESDLLQMAYDAAVHANPDTRAAVQQAESNRRQIEDQRKAAEAAETAKRTGSSLAGSPLASPVTAPAKSVEEELRRHWPGLGAAA
jgi:hypothetical protein